MRPNSSSQSFNACYSTITLVPDHPEGIFVMDNDDPKGPYVSKTLELDEVEKDDAEKIMSGDQEVLEDYLRSDIMAEGTFQLICGRLAVRPRSSLLVGTNDPGTIVREYNPATADQKVDI